MSACRAELGASSRRIGGCRLIALLVLLTTSAPAAWAQDRVIEVAPAPLGPPTLLLPSEPEPSQVERPETEPAKPLEPKKPEGFQIDRLADLHPEAMGTLDGERGALGPDLWRGSDRTQVLRLLPRVPTGTRSPAARDLLRRLVLSPGAPPGRPESATAARSTAFLNTRIALLLALGDTDSLDRLLALVPQRFDDDAIERVRVQSRMLSGDISGACPAVRAAIAERPAVTFWRQALVICQMAAGENDQAALSLDLLLEGGESEAFAALAEPASSGQTPRAAPTPLDLALLQVTRQPLSRDFVERVGLDLLPSIARAPDVDPDLRLLAAERAVAAGALDPQVLAEIYGGFAFPPESLNNAITLAPSLPEGTARALLFQVARAQSQPPIRAEVIKVALDLAAEGGQFLMAARLYAPLMAEIAPAAELLWFAGDAGRVFFATGRYEAGAAWSSVLRAAAPNSPEAARAATRLWAFARLAGQTGGAGSTSEADADVLRAVAGGEAPGRATLYFAALQGLGELPSAAWIQLVSGNAVMPAMAPETALVYALDQASAAGRPGETVLLSLLLLGESGPGKSAPTALAEVLDALMAVGLEREARALALEAAVAQGF
jgi:hypothetical protein